MPSILISEGDAYIISYLQLTYAKLIVLLNQLQFGKLNEF